MSGAAGVLADVAQQGIKGDIETGGKIGLAGILAGPGAQNVLFLSGATALGLKVG